MLEAELATFQFGGHLAIISELFNAQALVLPLCTQYSVLIYEYGHRRIPWPKKGKTFTRDSNMLQY